MKKSLLTAACLAFLQAIPAAAQVANPGFADTTSGVKLGKLTVGAYLDAYSGTSNLAGGAAFPYFVSSNRLNQFALNVAAIDVRYNDGTVRARLMPAWGSYVQSNYAPGELPLLEGNAGIKLHPKANLWLDGGVLGSPFTNESALSKDHLMYLRSFSAEYVPYYLQGMKLTAGLGEKSTVAVYAVNGWQQMQDQTPGMAGVVHWEYRPNARWLLNAVAFAGKEQQRLFPSSATRRLFADFYAIYQGPQGWKATADAYLGHQAGQGYWGQANAQVQAPLAKNWSLSGRLEYFHDPNQVVTPYVQGYPGFRTASGGLTLNYQPHARALLRLETRQFLAFNDSFPAPGLGKYAQWAVAGWTVWL
jgi:hypothetical protein